MSATNSSFQAPIPGQSLTHKMGSLPHEKPPQFVDPNKALEFIWKQLHQKEILKQIWNILEQGGTVWAITRAILYKAAMEGIIQMNLMISLGPVVGNMIEVIGKSKGIDVKLNPKFRDKTKDTITNKKINEAMGKQGNDPIPASALKSMILPKPEHITAQTEAFKKPTENNSGLLNMAAKE